MTLWRQALRALGLAGAAAVPAVALAHAGADAGAHHVGLAAWWSGFAHPFSGADHWAAMLALGLWSGIAWRRAWVAPLAFLTLLAVGAATGLAGLALPAAEPMIAASVLVLGLLVALHWTLPAAAGAAITGLFAVFHGHAHGLELAGPGQAAALLGMMCATALLHAAGIGLARWAPARAPWLPPLGGAALALFGAVLLGPFA